MWHYGTLSSVIDFSLVLQWKRMCMAETFNLERRYTYKYLYLYIYREGENWESMELEKRIPWKRRWNGRRVRVFVWYGGREDIKCQITWTRPHHWRPLSNHGNESGGVISHVGVPLLLGDSIIPWLELVLHARATAIAQKVKNFSKQSSHKNWWWNEQITDGLKISNW